MLMTRRSSGKDFGGGLRIDRRWWRTPVSRKDIAAMKRRPIVEVRCTSLPWKDVGDVGYGKWKTESAGVVVVEG